MAFDNEDIPDVNKNPLSDHQRPKVNAVESDPELLFEKDVRAVRMSMETVYRLYSRQGCYKKNKRRKRKKKTKKGNIICIIKGL